MLNVITLRLLRNGTLLTAPRKMPLCPVGIACFFVCAVRCAPARRLGRFGLSRLAYVQRPASLRFGTQTETPGVSWFAFLTPLHPVCT